MREYCSRCTYPKRTCLCRYITQLDSPVDILVIQHYKEAQHAKNTVRLAKLCIPELEIAVVKDDADIARICQRLSPRRCALLYPSETSNTLNADNGDFNHAQFDTLVVIDGSWRQSKGIYAALARHQSWSTWQLDANKPSQYAIRHTALDGAYSTLEAIAQSLDRGWSVNTTALYTLLDGFQQQWQGPQTQNKGIKKPG